MPGIIKRGKGIQSAEQDAEFCYDKSLKTAFYEVSRKSQRETNSSYSLRNSELLALNGHL